MSARRLVITGARGMVGSSILRHFYEIGWHITAACSVAAYSALGRISIVPFDLGGRGNLELEKAMSEAEAVIHCAAILPSSGLLQTLEGRSEIFRKNCQGTFDLMAMAANLSVGRFVFISSANLYAHPPGTISEDIPPSPADAYLLSKRVGEEIADMLGRTSKTRFYSFRVSAPYGPGFTAKAVIPIFVTRALAGQPLQLLGSGKREQVFTYVRDIARACESAIETDTPMTPVGLYNIAGPGPITMAELADAVASAVGGGVEITYSRESDPNEGVRRRVSIDRAKRDLGWDPIYDINRGLDEMVRDVRNPPERLILPIG